MDEKTFQSKLANLMGEINTLPESERKKLANLAEQTQQRHTKMKKTMGELQESLDYLRLSIKYLVFDLEATRRENQYLRDMISKQDADTNSDGPQMEDDHDDGQPF
jgi:chromosome segregation ATPase